MTRRRPRLVLRHPRIGRIGLCLESAFTSEAVGMNRAEGRRFVEDPVFRAIQESFVHRHRWQPGDRPIRDNHATQYETSQDCALPQRRLRDRTTVEGRRAAA